MVLTKAQAKSLDILEVARSLGMEMKRKSHREYYWAEHDSFKIDTVKNTWHWYSQNLFGDTINLVQQMQNVSYKDAMVFLETGSFPEAKPVEEERKPFNYTLAPYEQPFVEARAYLKDIRGLSDDTIDFFLEKGVLAQAKRKDKEGVIEDVLVFKYLDRNQQLVGASLQGLVPDQERHPGKGYLKQIMYQSEAISGLNVSIGSPERLIVTEAPIDLMSYYELHKGELNDVRLVAMEGLKEGVLSHYVLEILQDRGEIAMDERDYTKSSELTRTSRFLSVAAETSTLFQDHKYDDLITLAVDRDKAGTEFINKLREKKIPVIDARPPQREGQEKTDWNEILKQEKQLERDAPDNSRLAQARRKLERLRGEQDEAISRAYSHQALTNGQPVNDKRVGASFMRKQEQIEGQVFSKMDEIRQQEERVERLEHQQHLKEMGLNRQGSGLEMSVQNIPRIREELEKAKRGESFFTKATLKRYQKELTRLEAISEQMGKTSIQPAAQALIDEGLVNQWKKQPNTYFVKGLRRVALELTEEGEFQLSSQIKYHPKTDEERLKVDELLAKQRQENVGLTPSNQEKSISPQPEPIEKNQGEAGWLERNWDNLTFSIENKKTVVIDPTSIDKTVEEKQTPDNQESKELVWELHRKWEDELAEKIREDLGINHELQAWQFEKEMSRFITTDLDKLFAKRTRLERDAYFADSATSIRKEIDRLDAQILEYIEKAPEQSQEKTDWNDALKNQNEKTAENSRLTEGVNQSFDKENFIKGLELMQKYSVEEVLSRPPIYQGDDQRLEALQIDLEGFDYKPLDDFIRQYIDPNYDLDYEEFAVFSDYEEFAVFPDAWNNFFRNGAGKDLTVDSFITLAKNNGLVDEVPVVEPWQALTVLEPIKTYSVKNGDLQEDFDSVSGLLDFVKQKLSETERKILEQELAEVGRGTPTDILMTIDSALVGDFDVYVNGQSIISVYPNNIDEQATVLYVRSSEEAVKDVKKAPEQSQERLIDRTSGGTGSLQLNAEGSPTPVPETSTFEQTVTSHPTSSYPYLHFSTNYDKVQRRVGNYHPITPADLRRLNQYAPSIQSTASWYLSEMAGSKISFVYADHGEENVLQVTFQKENFIHLSGIRPFEEGKGAADFLEDFAAGRGHYDGMLISNAIKDKLQVLPMLQDILEPQSFVLDDLSSVEKLHNFNMSEAIKAKDEDFLLLFKDIGYEKIPASLMKLKGELGTNVKLLDEKIILGVYREREGHIEQLSINEEYVKDKGVEMLSVLKNKQYEEIKLDEQPHNKQELKRDADADGVSDEEELLQGTNPYDFRSKPGSKPEVDESLQADEVVLAAGSLAVADFIQNKDMAGLSRHLKEGIKEFLDSDKYKDYLTKMSKLNNYSNRNLRLILAQNPEARQVASFKQWKENFGRHVKKGEKALRIFKPMTKIKKDENNQPILDKNGKPETVTFFGLVPVFDVSQTEGKEMPKAAEVKEQLSDLDYANLYRALMAIAKENDVSVRFEEMENNKHGYYSVPENQIVLRSNEMNKAQIIKTFLHEMAHAELHHADNPQKDNLTRSTAELQAESVAYVVSSYYGIDTSEYSFNYLSGWSADKETLADLEAQLDIVQQEAKSLMVRMDQALEQLRLIQEKQTKRSFEQKLEKFKDQSKQAVEEHKQELKADAQSKKEKGFSK